MKTIELAGILEITWNQWSKIKLIQPDGYKIDLIARFQEVDESFKPKEVQVNYYLSDKPCTKDEMLEGWLSKLHGGIDARYESNDYAYSSWTSGTNYDSTLEIGGHNLMNELSAEGGKFIIIEINFEA